MRFSILSAIVSGVSLASAAALPEAAGDTTPWAGNLPLEKRAASASVNFWETGACGGTSGTYQLPTDMCFDHYRANAMTVWWMPPGCTVRYWHGTNCDQEFLDEPAQQKCVPRGQYRNSFMIKCS